MPRRLIVVPYFYPPFPGSGNRWCDLARHLRASGHSVTVVATDAFGRLEPDDEAGVIRVRDLRSSRHLRRLLRRGDLPKHGATSVEIPTTTLLTKILVPDANVIGWLPGAFAVVRRLLAEHAVDCLVTSSPTESTHLLGLLLGSRRPAWVADFRDGWGFEPLRDSFPTAAQRRLDALLERRVARAAEMVVGATRPIADDLGRRLGARSAYVPNGWDPAVLPGFLPDRAGDGGNVVTLVYTGALSADRDPTPVFRALRIVGADVTVPPIRLVLAGRLLPRERELIDASGVADSVEHVGVLSRSGALALQRTADGLLLITSRSTSEATGKLFEYLGAGRPILALAAGNEAERIVRETNTGVTVPPDDVSQIAAALRRLASGELGRAYDARGTEQYRYPAPADAMAEIVEEAIRRRADR
jgi:glycosyltransferase involved in cell wall biosynthesis